MPPSGVFRAKPVQANGVRRSFRPRRRQSGVVNCSSRSNDRAHSAPTQTARRRGKRVAAARHVTARLRRVAESSMSRRDGKLIDDVAASARSLPAATRWSPDHVLSIFDTIRHTGSRWHRGATSPLRSASFATLGLEVGARGRGVPAGPGASYSTGAASLKLLGRSAVGPTRGFGRRGLGCITSRCAWRPSAALKPAPAACVIDEQPRSGAGGSVVAFVHPSSTHGVLVELKQLVPAQPDVAPKTFQLGDLELVALSDGFFYLDGGAMFGVVPKPLWERHAPPDDRNRIRMSMRPLIVRGARTMLIDAGCGDKLPPKLAEIYRFERERHLDHSLAAAGIAPAAIDIVLASHLHFDHAGGFTVRDKDGRVRPRFPRAQYVIRRGEWEDAINPNERTRASYMPENYRPLEEAGVLQLVDDDSSIMPGVRVRRTGGHTRHHQMVMIESGGQTAVFAADALPMTAHLPDPWIMGYDLFPLETLSFKKEFLPEAVAREYLIFFEHDPLVPCIRRAGREAVRGQVIGARGYTADWRDGGSGLRDGRADRSGEYGSHARRPGPYLMGPSAAAAWRSSRGTAPAIVCRLPAELSREHSGSRRWAERIPSASAVGSLKYAPSTSSCPIVRPDEDTDSARFWYGLVAHISFAHPICRS